MPITALIELVAFVFGLAVVWGMIRSDLQTIRRDNEGFERRLQTTETACHRLPQAEIRISNIEALATKVASIDPLIERVTQFERHMGEKVDGLARTLDDLRELLFRAAARTRS